MTDSLKLAEMQRTSIEFERQRHLANWFIKSSPHMATPATPLSTNGGVNSPATTNGAGGSSASHNNTNAVVTQSGNVVCTKTSSSAPVGASGSGGTTITTTNPLFFLMSSSGNTGVGAGTTNGVPGAGNSGGGGKHASANGGIGNSEVTVTSHTSRAHQVAPLVAAAHHIEGRKPKLRRFNSHDTGANMFSVADFENARLARRNEIEMKQRLQRRMKMSASAQGACGYGANASGYGMSGGGGCLGGYGSLGGDCSTGDSKGSKHSNDSQTDPLPAEIFLDRYTLPRVVRISYKTKYAQETLQSSSSSSNGSSTMATTSSSTQSSSGNGTGSGTGTGTTSSSASSSGNINTTNSNTNQSNSNSNNNNSNSNNNINNGSSQQQQQQQQQHVNGSSSNSSKHGSGNTSNNASNGSGLDAQEKQGGELFLLYRLVRQRQIYHGFNAKTGVAHRKKGVMIPQEFPGYFSLVNEKGLPTATLYTTLIQLVRERVYKFVSVDNMSAFTESQTNLNANVPPNDSCGQTGGIVYHANGPPIPPPPPANTRPTYVKTTARGGQVFRLLAVFEDGKQDHSCSTLSHKTNNSHGREKEKGRYAQLLNEQRQVLYVSLATKGKFYEIEPGIPQILQKLSSNTVSGALAEQQRKVNPDCVHRITALVPPHTKEFPQTLRFISGPNGSSNSIPEQLSITKLTTETVVIACPIEDVEVQSPLHLRKLHLTADMQLVKCALGFESEQRMFANPNVQNILKFCQFNCDQFLRMVEVEVLNRPAARSGSKNRGGDTALRILKPLHLPKLLRREKTTINSASAHEKEDSIIFLSKHDLASLEAKEQQQQQLRQSSETGSSRISEKMKVFQTTKKKWFRRQDKHAVSSLTSLDLDVQAKRMSMERYNDMSKLLQERFGDKRANSTAQNGGGGHGAGDECISERSSSEIGCSDTETTTLHSIPTIEEKLQKYGKTKAMPLQKSQSLQDVELIGSGKPDLLRSHRANAADTISEAGTDIEDMENRPPSSNNGHEHPQSSFITEKLFSEFHVKTRQYSKSSSSLHQLIHFAAPQKLQLSEQQNKRSGNMSQIKQQQQQHGRSDPVKKQLDFNIGEPVTGRRAGGLSLIAAVANHSFSNSTTTTGNTSSSLLSPLTPTTISMLEDDLPYSSVRDSLVLSSDDSGPEQQTTPGQICQALHLIDYTKENIYAEICHNGVPHSQAGRGYCGSAGDEDEADDYGDYASLTPPYMSIGGTSAAGTGVLSTAAQAISRVQINCSSSPVSYHTVYLCDEPLGEHYAVSKRQMSAARQGRSNISGATPDLTNVTTVECVPTARMSGNSLGANEASASASAHTHRSQQQRNSHQQQTHPPHSSASSSRNNEVVAEQSTVDNIYNTLK